MIYRNILVSLSPIANVVAFATPHFHVAMQDGEVVGSTFLSYNLKITNKREDAHKEQSHQAQEARPV